jgi:hypothetical protein
VGVAGSPLCFAAFVVILFVLRVETFRLHRGAIDVGGFHNLGTGGTADRERRMQKAKRNRSAEDPAYPAYVLPEYLNFCGYSITVHVSVRSQRQTKHGPAPHFGHFASISDARCVSERLFRFELNSKTNGAPGGTRTHDLRLRRPLLYPAELRAHLAHAVRPRLCGRDYI